MRGKFVVLKSINGTDIYLSEFCQIQILESTPVGHTCVHLQDKSFHLLVAESPTEIIAKFEAIKGVK